MITNQSSNTCVDEISNGIYRISTPVPPTAMPGGFTFNQYLVTDDDPLLYHTGPRRLFPLVQEAISAIIPAQTLRYIGFSHYEADECGSLNEFLELAPRAEPLCSQVAKMVSVDDVSARPAVALSDGETLSLGDHVVEWIDTPYFPHAWECGHIDQLVEKLCKRTPRKGNHFLALPIIRRSSLPSCYCRWRRYGASAGKERPVWQLRRRTTPISLRR
jgi:hypothetical protein